MFTYFENLDFRIERWVLFNNVLNITGKVLF